MSLSTQRAILKHNDITYEVEGIYERPVVSSLEVEGFHFPLELYYHPDHTWAKIEGDRVRAGITPYAVHLAGEIRAITPRPVGKKIMIGGPIATLESNKWVGPMRNPISGVVVESNSALEKDPSPLINDPYGEGWICVLKPSSLQEDLKQLFHGEEAVSEWITMEIRGKGG
jgi:glycine cleavage system H protein